MRIDAWPAALFFCAALHAAAAAQPGYDLVPPRHDGPSKSPLTINEKTDEGIAAGERPEDHSMVNSPTDFCFYNHLNKCGSCVMDAGCGFCSDGPPSVKGRCMTGSKKGPTKYAGCKKWHYTVCALHSKPPAYVPAPPPAPKAIVEKPLVAEKKVQVKELPTNATKLTPWKVEQEVEAPVVHKKNKVGKKPSPSPVKAPATPKREKRNDERDFSIIEQIMAYSAGSVLSKYSMDQLNDASVMKTAVDEVSRCAPGTTTLSTLLVAHFTKETNSRFHTSTPCRFYPNTRLPFPAHLRYFQIKTLVLCPVQRMGLKAWSRKSPLLQAYKNQT